MFIPLRHPVVDQGRESPVGLSRAACFRAILSVATASVLAACGGDGGDSEDAQRLTYRLVEGSRISTVVGLHAPELTRALTGEFEVIVSERGPDEVVLRMLNFSLVSVEDDSYEVRSSTGGDVVVRRGENIDAAVSLAVNGSDETIFRGALAGEDQVNFLDEDPPVIRRLGIRNDGDNFLDRARVTYSMVINATVGGEPIEATKPPSTVEPSPVRTRKPTQRR